MEPEPPGQTLLLLGSAPLDSMTFIYERFKWAAHVAARAAGRAGQRLQAHGHGHGGQAGQVGHGQLLAGVADEGVQAGGRHGARHLARQHAARALRLRMQPAVSSPPQLPADVPLTFFHCLPKQGRPGSVRAP